MFWVKLDNIKVAILQLLCIYFFVGFFNVLHVHNIGHINMPLSFKPVVPKDASDSTTSTRYTINLTKLQILKYNHLFNTLNHYNICLSNILFPPKRKENSKANVTKCILVITEVNCSNKYHAKG